MWFFSVVVFLFHTGFRWPDGGLETLVAALFAAVALSGAAGLALTRFVPAQLTAHGENVVFERIPGLRSGLRREIEQLIQSAADKDGDIHLDRLMVGLMKMRFGQGYGQQSRVVRSPGVPQVEELLFKIGLGPGQVKEIMDKCKTCFEEASQ